MKRVKLEIKQCAGCPALRMERKLFGTKFLFHIYRCNIWHIIGLVKPELDDVNIYDTKGCKVKNMIFEIEEDEKSQKDDWRIKCNAGCFSDWKIS